jgi:hypothetical protein
MRRAEMQNRRYGVVSARVEADARDETVTPLRGNPSISKTSTSPSIDAERGSAGRIHRS